MAHLLYFWNGFPVEPEDDEDLFPGSYVPIYAAGPFHIPYEERLKGRVFLAKEFTTGIHASLELRHDSHQFLVTLSGTLHTGRPFESSLAGKRNPNARLARIRQADEELLLLT